MQGDEEHNGQDGEEASPSPWPCVLVDIDLSIGLQKLTLCLQYALLDDATWTTQPPADA